MNSIYSFPDKYITTKHLGKILKKLRKNQHITQEDFAIQCQVSRNTISLIECGKLCPTFDVIYRICIVLEIQLSDFMIAVENSLHNTKEKKSV